MNKKQIFVSHRSIDKELADILLDFLAVLKVPKESVFCSSLPGSDIKTNIPKEIKEAILDSKLNIAIISNGYNSSAYCLNEAGIIWFRNQVNNIPVIIIGTPEIQHDSLIGLLGSEYKIRRLNNEDDIAEIYDQVTKVLSVDKASSASLIYEIKKLIEKYNDHINKLVIPIQKEKNINENDCKGVLISDKDLFQKICNVFSDDVRYWIVEWDFGGPHPCGVLKPLSVLLSESSNPFFEFRNSELEMLRRNLINRIDSFDYFKATHTFRETISGKDHYVTNQWLNIYRERNEKYAQQFEDDVNTLNKLASEVWDSYCEFVRQGRRLLNI